MSVKQSNQKPAGAPPPVAVSADEGAHLLGISRRLWWQWHSRGLLGPLPVINLGRVVRWSRQELVDWIAAGHPPRERWAAVKEAAARQQPRARAERRTDSGA